MQGYAQRAMAQWYCQRTTLLEVTDSIPAFIFCHIRVALTEIAGLT